MPATAAFWAAAGGFAALLGILLALLGHMFAFAKGQGARDEREKQAAAKIAALEATVAQHGSANAAFTTQLALLAQSVTSLKEGMEKSMEALGTQLTQIVNNLRTAKATATRRAGEHD